LTHTNVARAQEVRNSVGPKSQLRLLTDHLCLKGTVSQLEAYNLYRISRLTSRVHELKKKGMDIITEEKRDVTGKRYVRYHLV
jgi:hypothetical protein